MSAVTSAQLETIRRAVVEEMRESSMFLQPPGREPRPADLDAEQEVLSALLNQHTTVEALTPLQPKHLYSLFNQRLFTLLAMTSERELQVLADLLEARGPVV